MPELNFALQPSFLALGQSAPASDAGIFKGADIAQRNKDRAVQEKQVNAQLARDALNAQLQPLRMREAELKVEDMAADMAWESTRRELESQAAKTFNAEMPKLLSMQQAGDAFGAYNAGMDMLMRFPILGGYGPMKESMELLKGGAQLKINKDKATNTFGGGEVQQTQLYDDDGNPIGTAVTRPGGRGVTVVKPTAPPIPRDSRTPAQKNADAKTEQENATRMARGDAPMNPAEETAFRQQSFNELTTRAGMSITTRDAAGNETTVTTGKPAASASDLTIAERTETQKQIANASTAALLANGTLEGLSPESVGIRGWINQNVINQGLTQIFPDAYKGEVSDARNAMIQFNEAMLKAMKSDSQMNKEEAKRLMASLPDPGAIESYPDAQGKIINTIKTVADITENKWRRIGGPKPNTLLHPSEIKEMYSAGKFGFGQAAKDEASRLIRGSLYSFELEGEK